ncbi:hypothetical protein EJB05_00283, partial [Eragrostis curvula]
MGVAMRVGVDRRRNNFVEAGEVDQAMRCLLVSGGEEEGSRAREGVQETRAACRRAVEQGGSSDASRHWLEARFRAWMRTGVLLRHLGVALASAHAPWYPCVARWEAKALPHATMPARRLVSAMIFSSSPAHGIVPELQRRPRETGDAVAQTGDGDTDQGRGQVLVARHVSSKSAASRDGTTRAPQERATSPASVVLVHPFLGCTQLPSRPHGPAAQSSNGSRALLV